jgi:hypothetical protein
MSDLMEAAIARLRALPDEQRAGVAAMVMQMLEANDALSASEIEALDAQLAAPRDDASDAEIAAVFARRRG